MSNDPFDNEDERTTVSPMSTAPGSVPPVPSKDTRSKKSLPSPPSILNSGEYGHTKITKTALPPVSTPAMGGGTPDTARGMSAIPLPRSEDADDDTIIPSAGPKMADPPSPPKAENTSEPMLRKRDTAHRLAARAGIHDQRDGLSLEARNAPLTGPLDVSSSLLRVEDIELLSVDAQVDELGSAPEPTDLGSAQMVVFFGPKGGMGTTTLAVNAAGTLAALGHAPVIVDMDLQLGCVPIALNMRTERTLAELVMEAETLGEGPLETVLDAHSSGIAVAAQTRIEELGEITTDRLPRFFEALGHGHPYIIVDGLRDFNDHAVATMDLAHLVVLVVTQDVPAVRAAARSLRLFRRLGYPPERLRLVINRFSPKAPITLDNIASALGRPVDFTVGNDFPLIEQALNHGHMASDLDASAPVSRDLRNLGRMLAGEPAEPDNRGFFARLFSRR